LTQRCGLFLARHWPALTIGAAVTLLSSAPSAFDPLVASASAPMGFAVGALIERTFAAAGWTPPSREAFIAELPLYAAMLVGLLAHAGAERAVRAGSLDAFYAVAAALLGGWLTHTLREGRELTERTPWLRAFRGWWTCLICMGIACALMGLVPGHSRSGAETQFEVVCGALATALAAVVILARRRPCEQAPTRTPEPPTPASRPAARR
jgi:hypothetical protein